MQGVKSPLRDAGYLAWVRTLPCGFCRAARPSEAHHVVPSGGGRMGKKTDDDRTVPVCRVCHSRIHAGEIDKGTQNEVLIETLIEKRRQTCVEDASLGASQEW